MKNKFKFVAIACVTMLAFSFTGCGGDEIEIDSWGDTSVERREPITYNPSETEESTSSDEIAPENETDIDNETTTNEEDSGSLFKFGTTNTDEDEVNDDETNEETPLESEEVENNESEETEVTE